MLRPAHRLRRWRTPAAVLAALLAAPAVAVGSASAARADAVRQQEQWVLNAIDVTGAWQHTHGSGVTVALIDSGVNGQVSDLSGSVTTGRDFSGVNTPPENTNWGVHGTWMASLIAGHGHAPGGSSGIAGVAPAAKILSIRAVTDQGDPGYHRYQHESESRVQGHLAEAIRYATSKRAGVISMSLGYQGASLPVRSAIAAALAEGIVVVASSGNSGGASSGQHGNAPYSFPADYPGVLGVGAISQSGMPAGFSSANLSVQVAAPGVRVPAQGRDGQYWLVSGTSPACALTAGVAALIKSVYPTLAPALVVQAITASTANKPHDGYDEQVGFGTLDATAALKMAGRLARDQDTGHGLVAAAQFGGGPAAIPAVPVTPRNKRQLLVDSLAALGCLVVVLVLVFRLIVTRRPAVVGAPGGWVPGAGPGRGWGAGSGAPAGPGAPAGSGATAGWARGNGVPDGWAGGSAASAGWASGRGAPDGRAGGSGASAGWASGPGAPDGRAGAGALGSGPGGSGPGGVGPAGTGLGGSGAGGTWPGGGEGGYGRSAGYWASGGYKPPGGLRPPMGLQQPADPGPPAGTVPPVGYREPADSAPLSGAVPPVGYREPAGSAPPSSTMPSSGYRGPAGPGRPAGYGAPGAYYQPADSLPPAEPGPLAGYPEPTEPQGLPGGRADDLPPADDDTWPSSGPW